MPSIDDFYQVWRRLAARLWFRPLLYSLLAVASVFAAHLADTLGVPAAIVPSVASDTIEKLLTIIASSMLAVATFSVASMLSAFSSAATSATPRAVKLVIGDSRSQRALSSFIGAFIFAVIAITALKTGYYGDAGRFALFIETLLIFSWVVLTFVRWVDDIARLGRIGTAIEKTEQATCRAIDAHRRRPGLGAVPFESPPRDDTMHVRSHSIGYVNSIALAKLQEIAESLGGNMTILSPPGAFLGPDRPLVRIFGGDRPPADAEREAIRKAFTIAEDRNFESDPRFGVVVLAEIAQRALSPAVNDPGTAIVIIGKLVRLFVRWATPIEAEDEPRAVVQFPRVELAPLSVEDMFDDAFTAIARDGAGNVAVMLILQKALRSLASVNAMPFAGAARAHARAALARAEAVMTFPGDVERVRAAASNGADSA